MLPMLPMAATDAAVPQAAARRLLPLSLLPPGCWPLAAAQLH